MAEVSKVTFDVQPNLKFIPMPERDYVDFTSFLYRTQPVRGNNGRVLVTTQPDAKGGRCIRPHYENGFVATLCQAFGDHRHLVCILNLIVLLWNGVHMDSSSAGEIGVYMLLLTLISYGRELVQGPSNLIWSTLHPFITANTMIIIKVASIT